MCSGVPKKSATVAATGMSGTTPYVSRRRRREACEAMVHVQGTHEVCLGRQIEAKGGERVGAQPLRGEQDPPTHPQESAMQYAVQSPPPAAPSRADRPSRAQIEPAALALLARHSAGLLATARRYSICPQDAEDAYQRGVEILLTKAPSTREDELLPWLRTVVKHEAFAVA